MRPDGVVVTNKEMFSKRTGSDVAVFLHPGRLTTATRPTLISTILGSCVALCLWDETTRMGGINHYLLPSGPSSAPDPNRFGSNANPRLLADMLAAGAARAGLRAMLFGGGCVIRAFRNRGESHLGVINAEIATSFLASESIPLVLSDVGGDYGRKITFRTGDGRVSVKHL